MLQEQVTLPVGATIRSLDGDRYEIEGLLGAGGFGAVYLVRERRGLKRFFALKEVIDPSKREHERFLFEADLLKRLHHRALPHVYHVFEQDKSKRIYMLMDYVQGRNLADLREEQPDQRFSLPVVLALMAPIVDALAYLHHQNPPIVHRDVKPENIIVPIEAEEAVLVDFSIAKEYVAERTTTVIRHGSPGYAALEQYGTGTTPRTDIYGLGATIYTLLTGVVPPNAIMRASQSQGFDPLEPAYLLAPDLPLAVAETIERAISISSKDRFATIEEFWQKLTGHALLQANAQAVHSISPQPLTVFKQTLPDALNTLAPVQHRRYTARTRKSTFLVSILLALLLAVVVGTSFFILRHDGLLTTSPEGPHPLASSTAQFKGTSTASSPTSILSPGTPLYPRLATSYAGGALDLMTKEKTAMFLTNVQQSQGKIRGYFQGLGLAGSLQGTITPGGHLQFLVTVQPGRPTLLFEGDIKIGGDLTGNFEALDQHGQRTGESGIWNVGSSS